MYKGMQNAVFCLNKYALFLTITEYVNTFIFKIYYCSEG